ncbi:tyrosyl-DNA phosphodiesterase [Neocallimastix californiae]|uniref:Tyrosyl-DNA phosphodiesterase n=1 Tax=Neocallimastix californiae TaxID=1754190 RepID=A0A1Y2B244_9FUNG|nr:tyrosyl-DNA phosphodiesterase [Neocallimastix californiae]|eukprot:ORY28557.1 tyrosyl-DNA phosphodiesterase [Neocallimastix californiae]
MNLTRVENLQNCYNKNTVTLSSLLSKKKSTNIIQFNFLLDLDWFMTQVPLHSRNTAKILFIHGIRDIPESSQLYPNTRFLAPHIPLPYGSHHTKAMLLFYDDYTMQVVIHTANLVPGDWYFKTQAVWTSPFLSKKTDEYIKSGRECEFEKELCKYIRYYNIPVLNRLAERVSLYNFEECKAILISSVPGIHRGKELNNWGHLQLRNILNTKYQMKFNTSEIKKESYIIAQMSSIGALGKDDRWLNKEFGQSLRNSISGIDSKVNIKLIYPTVDNVRNSLEGWNGGNCLPFSNSNWQKQSNYMGKILNIWKADNSGRTKAMPHIKTYTRIDNDEISWFLLTSANLSKAAWGTLQKQGNQLMIRNYELGVLILPELFDDKKKNNVKITNYYDNTNKIKYSSNIKTVAVPIPFDLPLTPYPPKSVNSDPNTTSPWTWDVQRNDLDLFGRKYCP